MHRSRRAGRGSKSFESSAYQPQHPRHDHQSRELSELHANVERQNAGDEALFGKLELLQSSGKPEPVNKAEPEHHGESVRCLDADDVPGSRRDCRSPCRSRRLRSTASIK